MWYDNLRGGSVDATEKRDLLSTPLRWPRVAWYIYTKFHDDRFRHSCTSTIKGITPIWKAIVLILLMREIYDVHPWDGLWWHNIHTEFHDDRFGHSSNIKVITSTIWEAAVLVLLMRGIHKYVVEMGSCGMRHLPSFMKIGSRIRVTSRILPQQFERLWCWYCWWEGVMKYAVETA
jgi:hypothetical protein